MSTPIIPATDLRSQVVQAAKNAMEEAVGTDYTPNGRTTDGFDCSGFVTYVLQKVFPEYKHKNTDEIAASSDFTKVTAYRPGDLIFFPSGTVRYALKHKDLRKYPNHIGIVVDHGHWISSQTSTGPAKVAMNNVWWGSRTSYFLSYIKLTN